MASTIRIDFDALIADYLNNLNVTLRGFQAAEGYDFLETYVPSDDPGEALFDLLELARDGRAGPIAVKMSRATFSRIDLERIKRLAPAGLSVSETEDGVELSCAWEESRT